MIPFEIPPRINVEDAFRLCVHFSEFTAKLDDGSFVDVPQNYDEWTVNYQCYTLDMLEKDLASRIKWGSGQQLRVSEFVVSGVGERKLLNDTDLSLAFAERKNERKVLLVVGVVDIPTEIDWDSLQITPLTGTYPPTEIIRHVVNIKNHICTCREWQVSGKPCPNAMALITTYRNPKMEDYLHPYFSVYHFRIAYGGVIRPLPDMSQWAHVNLGFKVLPPLEKREPGRQRKLRIPSCIEGKGNKPRGKGMWQVKCKKCLGFGHRSTSPKCPMNGTKKRKSRAKKGKAGRPPGSSKRQNVAEQGSPRNNSLVTASQFPSATGELECTRQINISPGPVTRRQSLLAMVEVGGSNQISTSFGHITTSQTGEEAQNTVSTPTKSPARHRIGLKKKLTPRKGRNSAA